MKNNLYAATALAALATALPAAAQQGDGTEVAITAHVVKPNKAEPTSDRLAQVKAPDGFTVKPFASGLKNARIIALPPTAIFMSAGASRAMFSC
jgi:hypothetical protein